MKTDLRFLDTDEWQGLYENGKLVIECRSQDVGEIVMRVFTEHTHPGKTLKRLYISGSFRCPEYWTEELEEKAK